MWGRWVESAVGAHLVNAAACGRVDLYWWRDGNEEVDFVVTKGAQTVAIEVESSPRTRRLSGLEAFCKRFEGSRPLVVGGDGMSLDDLLRQPVERWFSR